MTVNCSAFAESLLEGELFGHSKGAYTGADARRAGIFEAAEGGTVFLDEIADMSPACQAKVLRTLQEGEVRSVGSTSILKVNVRIVAATNADLEERCRDGRFRKDLFYRLNVVKTPEPLIIHSSSDPPVAPGSMAVGPIDLPFHQAKAQIMEQFERGYLTALLDRYGSITAAADAAGLDRSNFKRLLWRHSLPAGKVPHVQPGQT